ncbi:hypothetical protein Tco_0743504 [Tanacetum coccineum]
MNSLGLTSLLEVTAVTRCRGNQRGDAPQQAKIINMIRTRLDKEKNRKARETTEAWINTPITFPLVSTEDVSKEPLIVEAEVEGKNY